MHNRLTDLLEKNNMIYPPQFGFRKNYSSTHALIHLTNVISECSEFDLQRAFYTVDHETVFSKLDHYRIRGVANKWFETYFFNRKQYVSFINGFKSNTSTLTCGVPQDSVLEP